MSFALTESQQILKEQTQAFLNDRQALKITRGVLEDAEPAVLDMLWRDAAALGWTATTIPETLGGYESGGRELCLLAKEVGRSLCPLPFTSSVGGVTQAIRLFGDAALQQRLLPELAGGAIRGAIAIAALGHLTDSLPTAKKTADGFSVSGRLRAVPAPALADYLVFPARDGDRLQLLLASLEQPGIALGEPQCIDPSRPVADITMANIIAEPLSGFDGAARSLEPLLNYYLSLLAHELAGMADACLEMARNYALERRAFGRAIGSFQAIKHRLADMYVSVELAHSNCAFASWAMTDNSAEWRLAAPAAFLAASHAATFCATENIQIHGGIGFSWEMDCHLYYRRAKALSLEALPPAHWKQVLARHLLAA